MLLIATLSCLLYLQLYVTMNTVTPRVVICRFWRIPQNPFSPVWCRGSVASPHVRQICKTANLQQDDTKATGDGDAARKRVLKIYTRTGDKGTTSLFTGERRPKSDLVFDALGDVDEVTSNIGLAKNTLMDSWQNENFKDIADKFEKIQCVLQDVNSCIATPLGASTAAKLERTRFDDGLTEELEEWIDFYTDELPPLKSFILPSGGIAACRVHVTRTICRRAERKVTQLVASGSAPNEVSKYLNRLSDFFFTIARYVAMMEGHVEKTYKKPVRRRKDEGDEELESA